LKRFVLTPEARADLQDIWEFIAEDSCEAADRVLEDFRSSVPPPCHHVRIGLQA
jgi:plasmid stabilization system protein ParE